MQESKPYLRGSIVEGCSVDSGEGERMAESASSKSEGIYRLRNPGSTTYFKIFNLRSLFGFSIVCGPDSSSGYIDAGSVCRLICIVDGKKGVRNWTTFGWYNSIPYSSNFKVILLSSDREELGRTILFNERHMETYLNRNGEFIEEHARNTQDKFDRHLSLKLSEHPELPGPPPRYSVDPSVDFQTWYDVSGGKKKNGRVYSAGGYAKTIKRHDRNFTMRLADGEGTSTQPILTAKMLETVRNLANIEEALQVAARNAETEEIKKKQLKMQQEMQRRETELREEMRRQSQEYQEAMRIANECVQRFDQFFA
ncbi:unnamed protein product [Vicia faba]|uniref:Uncharacterized protein n=1 Tax=Vicia faba TaxID=3906 RepID=A0AAV0YIZ2_VICFA|nr:unnamed protein product [Vicia faba]